LKFQRTDVKAPESLPGTSRIRREFGEASEAVAPYGPKQKGLSARSLSEKRWVATTPPVQKEVSSPKQKEWDKQSKEQEPLGSDKADPTRHNSRISPAPPEPAQEDWKKALQPRPL
jgi:hypothetical protein